MFTREELEPGAKRVVLEYIAQHGIPIARILSPEEAQRIDNRIRRYGGLNSDLIFRQDHACQWDGFSGIYGSYQRNRLIGSGIDIYIEFSKLTIEQILALTTLDESIKVPGMEVIEGALLGEIKRIKESIDWYCEGLGIEKRPYDTKALIQEMHGEDSHLFQHPNDPNLVVIFWNDHNVFYDREQDKFEIKEYAKYRRKGIGDAEAKLREDEDYLRKAIGYYDTIAQLPKFADYDSTFEMEFGKHKETGELVVYQVKLFRKKENRTYCLLPKEGDNTFNFDLAIGITGLGGVELTVTTDFDVQFSDRSEYSSMVKVGIPSGSPESIYPHISLPGLSGLIHPGFRYSYHGIREGMMKVPFVLCGLSEGDPHEFVYGLEDGQKLRLYADGRKGMIELY